jgi:glutathione S-transferase
MDLYFSPLACSMATRIALYEAGGSARFIEVDTKAKRLVDGSDFLAINPLGYVPVIRTDEGELLTENSAILQHVAARFPDAALAPADGIERSRLQAWLSFIGTELHKGLFIPLLDRKAPEAAKQYAVSKYGSRLDYLNTYLDGREFLLDRFSIADAYLTTVLNWSRATTLDLEQWPAVKDYFDRMRARPAIARAFTEEGALFVREQTRHKAA